MSNPLPPCPRCSSRYHLEIPLWQLAHRTTQKRGKNCFMWVGCAHASKVCDLEPVEDVDRWTVEEAWAAESRRLFEAMTLRWTPGQRELHARTVGFSLEPPAQPKPTVATTDNDKSEIHDQG